MCRQSLHLHRFPWLEQKVAAYLVASQLEGDSDVDGLVDHADNRTHQGHEEQWEPDDGHKEQDYEAAHAVFNNLLLLLPLGLRVFLEGCGNGQLCIPPALLPGHKRCPKRLSPCCSWSHPPCPAPPLLSCPQAMLLGSPSGPIKSNFD